MDTMKKHMGFRKQPKAAHIDIGGRTNYLMKSMTRIGSEPMTMESCGILGPSAPRAAVTDEADDRKEQATVAIVAKGTRTCEFKPREEVT